MPALRTSEKPITERQTDTLPLLPRPVTSAGRASAALADLRRFHFRAREGDGETAAGDWQPALLRTVSSDPQAAYPMFLGPPEAGPAVRTLPELFARLLPDGTAGLAHELRQAAAADSGPLDAQELLDALAHESARALAETLPAGGRFLPFSGDVSIHLLRYAAAGRVQPARTQLHEEVRALMEQGRARFSTQQDEDEPAASGAALGALGGRFIDPSALAGVVRQEESSDLSGDERLAQDLRTLHDYLAGDEPPELILIDQGEHELDSAAALFDREASTLARVVRAMRRLRLAIDGSYEPERHNPWLDQLDWQAFSREELRALPVVAAMVSADQVAGEQMAPLSHLLLSGRPVQVLVTLNPSSDPGAEAFAGFRFEPAYLGLAHREVLVQQTTAAEPAHLARGLLRAVDATHAALHVISTSPMDPLAVAGRALPLFHFDPEAGSDWAERLDFSFNPDPEHDWGTHNLRVRKPAGGEDVLPLVFTFADFALLDPVYAPHFRLVPDEVPGAELVDVAAFCASPEGDEPAAIPFVWAVDGRGGHLARLAVSRPLALACRDRLDFWRTLQGLAGVRSVYVSRAVAAARREVEAKALEERLRLERLHAEELDRLRHDATRDVVDQLTSALTDVDVSELVGLDVSPTILGGFHGRSVDEVAAELMELVDPATLDDTSSTRGDERVDRLAAELMRAV